MRILCLDVGDRRIGTALSDPLQITASPLGIIERCDQNQDIQSISQLVTSHNVVRVVVGLPVSLTGRISQQAASVQSFIANLTAKLDVPVVSWDEALSTVRARQIIASKTRKKVDFHDDAVAAAVILQSYLDENPPLAPVPGAGV